MKYFVAVPTSEISEAVQKLLFSKGLSWCAGQNVKLTSSYFLCWDDDRGNLSYMTNKLNRGWFISQGYTEISIEQISELEPKLRIESYAINIFEDYVEANGQKFTYEIVKSIIERMK